MSIERRALLLFAKQPAAGQTKTRLAPLLGLEGAASFYECLLRDALLTARMLPNTTRAIAYAPAEAQGFFAALAPDFACFPQVGADLGERMDRALGQLFAGGAATVVLVGSDIPLLTPALLEQAFAELVAGADVVLGPAEDGGYYLLAVRQPRPELLRDIPMSTPHVLRDTLARAAAAQLRVALLPMLYDVDTPADLQRLRTNLLTAPLNTAPHTRAYLLCG